MWDDDKPLSSFGVRKNRGFSIHGAPEVSEGTIIRNYRFGNRIGQGGFGEVYRAENTTIKQAVAIKLYRVDDPNALRAFQRGANFLAQIRHPNIITIHDFFTLNGFALTVMELLDPDSTARRCVGEFQNSERIHKFLAIFFALLEAMRHCHQLQFRDLDGETKVGIYHGDIKPDNVFMHQDTLKLSDFMIPDLERFMAYRKWGECFPYYDTRMYGTEMYMSPEQFRGNVSEQTDIYNIGITCFELLTGFYPYESEDEFRRGRYQLPERFNPYCPKWLSEILVRCVKHDTNARYQHIAEIQSELLVHWTPDKQQRPGFAAQLERRKSSPNVHLSDGASEEAVCNRYQVGLSFAGEDRIIARQLADLLTHSGISVFFDEYEQVDLWGKDLYQHLAQVYQKRCRFCVILLSKDYASKLWTRHELQHAQARAFRENREYILPLRIDDTAIPGITETIGYIDLRNKHVEEVVQLIIEKLRKVLT